MPTMTQTEYADHRRVSQTTISNYIKNGKIPKTCLKKVVIDGRTYTRIDAEIADAALEGNIDSRKQRETRVGPGGKGINPKRKMPADIKSDAVGSKGLTLDDAIRFERQYKALLARLDYEERMATLCPTKDFERTLKTQGRAIRDGIRAVPAQVKYQLAKETDPDKLETLLADILDKTFVSAIPKKYHKILDVEEIGNE